MKQTVAQTSRSGEVLGGEVLGGEVLGGAESVEGRRAFRPARQERGAETRERLIEAALDIFGHQGFEGATTREIAKRAEANLAAIVYHFGSKEALYRAVAEYIVASISAATGSALASAEAAIDRIEAFEARALLIGLLSTFVDVILGNPQAERWARFIVREQLDPTPAFEILYGFMGRAHLLATRLVAIACGADPESAAMKIKTFTLLGQAIVFRIAQPLILRRLERESLGPEQRALIKATLAEQVTAILSGECNVP